MMAIVTNLTVLLCALLSSVSALDKQNVVSFSQTSGSFLLADGSSSPSIIVDNTDWAGVIRAAGDLAHDFGRVTGSNGTVSNVSSLAEAVTSGPVIIVGTVGKSILLDGLIDAGKISISATKGQWEAFTTTVVQNVSNSISQAVVIAGADKRGTIYGIYDISSQIGVSPWYWWADVPTKQQSTIYALNSTKVQQSPTVKYRGLFLNDEQPALNNWVQSNFPNGKYGPGFNHDFYGLLFELLLRLRANYLWPASWNSMFYPDDALNGPTADMYGVVMGTSHTEPMMRATKEQSTFLNGTWSWATNKQNVLNFMRYGAERARPWESLYSMGMRGLGDVASPTLNSSALQTILHDQEQILSQVYDTNDTSTIPQMWCLYKEVGAYYEEGLTVPDEVTILWSDDNWGNPSRLPIGNESERPAGSGVYYHFDYVGDPRDYKWINTINLQKTYEQMQLSYARGAREIWILNVGDMKPLELPINHFFDLAYNAPRWSDTNSTLRWSHMWATQQYGAEAADATIEVMTNYSVLAGRRKYELVDPTTHSLINYNEADNILAEWATLVNAAQAIYNSLDASTQASFFEMILHPALAGSTLYHIYVDVAKNNLYTSQERSSANTWAQQALSDFQQDHNITETYHKLLDGKWMHMMDQTHLGYYYWQQPMRNSLPAIGYTQQLENGLPGMMGVTCEAQNASVPGDDEWHTLSTNALTLPPMDPYGPATRWIDIFSRGTSSFDFNISTNSYVTATPSHGTLSGSSTPNGTTDTRVLISVDWASVPSNQSISIINITTTSSVIAGHYGSFGMPSILLPLNKTFVPASFHGHVESDATISILPAHFSANTSSKDSSAYYEAIPNAGRELGVAGITLYPPLAPSQDTSSKSPKLSYDIYTFTPTPVANITVYINPALNTNPNLPIKYAIAVNAEKPQTIQPIPSTILGTLPDMWTNMVSNAVASNTTTHDLSKIGQHRLDLWLLEPGITLQKVVVDLGGVRSSYLGPPESMRV
jgi:Glycosyl hydrolase family 115/Gylcosyl hydrolase family 115 C-terminal domain